MRKTNGKKRITPLFCGFLALALLFLALGLGTLGSFRDVGGDYEFNVAKDDQQSEVVFTLPTSVTVPTVAEDGTESERSVSNLRVVDVYVYTTAVYSPVGTSAGLMLERSSSKNSFTSTTKFQGALENIYYEAPPAAEPAEGEEKDETEAPLAPTATDTLYRWTKPFSLGEDGWSVSSYRYVRLTATTHNVRLGEVVFVAISTSDGEEGNRFILPATVDHATPVIGQNNEQAKAAAEALLDAQPAEEPKNVQSTFAQFTKEEIYSALTIREMQLGNVYPADAEGNVLASYNGDRVYGALGIDILALGVKMFGLNPFGLRFFSMLAAFATLIVGFFFVKQLLRSERAGFIFAVLYVFSCMTFSLGRLGTPLMIGVFFFAMSLFLVHRFYARGMRHANPLGALPLFLAGLFGAAAMLVNGAFAIPVAAVSALYVFGMVRQQHVKKALLQKVAEPQTETNEETSESEEEETAEQKAARIHAEYRYKNILAGLAFPISLLLGTLLMSLLFLLPAYFAFVKLYDNPASPALNLFGLGWKSFAAGFAGENVGAMTPAFRFGYTLFQGTGAAYSVTLCCINVIASIIAVAGIAFAVYRIIGTLTVKEKGKKERKLLRAYLVPLVLFAVSLITASFANGGFAFILIALLSAFALAAVSFDDFSSESEKNAKAMRIVGIVCTVLLVAAFVLAFVFVFSVPLPAAFMEKIF